MDAVSPRSGVDNFIAEALEASLNIEESSAKGKYFHKNNVNTKQVLKYI